tara:strand:+ start:174 stop:473 length:300 start_codon:yes stop_codon:yes gene_type:complete
MNNKKIGILVGDGVPFIGFSNVDGIEFVIPSRLKENRTLFLTLIAKIYQRHLSSFDFPTTIAINRSFAKAGLYLSYGRQLCQIVFGPLTTSPSNIFSKY